MADEFEEEKERLRETWHLFSKLRKMAHIRGPYCDKRLEELAEGINPNHPHAFYLGNANFKEAAFNYVFLEWQGQASVSVIDNRPNQETGYMFFDFATNDKGLAKKLQGIYSTKLAKKDPRFKGQMGSVVLSPQMTPEEEELTNGMLIEAMNAKADINEN